MPEAARPGIRQRLRAGGLEFRLTLAAIIAAALVVINTLLWLATGLGYFWPIWVMFGLGCALALQVTVQRVLEVQGRAERRYRASEGIVLSTCGILFAIWLITGGGSFWPGWTIFSLLLVLGLHRVLFESSAGARAQELLDRVDQLTATRSGALDVQNAELRRIERDLHDGAQARLVALSMQLGRAEHRLGADGDPKVLELIRGAQEDARLAITELRDLARGIAPPVLIDRGLAAAVEALGKRSMLEVEVTAQIAQRPSAVVESAAYFVTAEALTNAAKHSPGAAVHISLIERLGRLQVAIADDGVGGADPAGGGLTGLRQRVEALDGTLHVASTAGRGTTITAELPCGS